MIGETNDTAPCPTCGAPETTSGHREACRTAAGEKEVGFFTLDEQPLDTEFKPFPKGGE